MLRPVTFDDRDHDDILVGGKRVTEILEDLVDIPASVQEIFAGIQVGQMIQSCIDISCTVIGDQSFLFQFDGDVTDCHITVNTEQDRFRLFLHRFQ